MNLLETAIPRGWTKAVIEELLVPLEDGRILHQGWSPQCDKEPSSSVNEWGVLKTTSIQAAAFLPEHNKRLPGHLRPRPLLEVKAGDILMTCAGPRVRCGVACLVRNSRERLMISGKMYRFRVRTDRVDPRYLEAFLQTSEAREMIDRMKTGINESGLNLTHDRFLRITVPIAPLQDQRRIVSELEKQFSRLDEAVANLKRVKANLKRYKAAVLKAAVEGKLTEEWRKQHPNIEPANKLLERILAERRAKWSGRGKYKEPERPDLSDLPALPDEWTWCAVDQVSRKITDGEHISPACRSAGVPLLSAKDVRESGVLLDAVKYVSPENAKRFRMRCDPDRGDILLVSRGATIGRSCKVNTDQMFCLMGSVILIKACGAITAAYVLTALKSLSGLKRLMGASGSTAQQAIYIQDIRSLPIPLPPHDEQKQIVAEVERRLSVIDELEATVEANLTRADRMRQSILNSAYTGKLSHSGIS